MYLCPYRLNELVEKPLEKSLNEGLKGNVQVHNLPSSVSGAVNNPFLNMGNQTTEEVDGASSISVIEMESTISLYLQSLGTILKNEAFHKLAKDFKNLISNTAVTQVNFE